MRLRDLNPLFRDLSRKPESSRSRGAALIAMVYPSTGGFVGRLRREGFTINLDGSNIIKENIKRRLHPMKNHLNFTKKLVHRMILIWLLPTTTLV